ncbi:MAG: hypothetical protein GY816_13365 [Cytophagales bacterium]|nr:hypothetical protein [Cytophagales bacterium]
MNIQRGFFNRYHKNMPFLERLLKDINHLICSIKVFFKKGKINNVIIHPHYPSRKATIYRICRELGLQVTNRAEAKAILGVFYEYTTFKKEFGVLQTLAEGGLKVLNIQSRDISKNYVDAIHQEVFGYSTRIDPTNFNGKCVRKSDTNALHDGIILDCPIEKIEEGFIYQILIDNKNDKGFFEDMRIAIVGQELPICYLKYRNDEQQFGHKSTADLTTVEKVLSSQEIEKVKEFAKISKIDFAEIDILRDKKDGKIYVIDVNDTPQSARDNVSKEELVKNIQILAASFERQFLSDE